MGAYCQTPNHQQEHINDVLYMFNQRFYQVKQNHDMLQQIKTISNNQIPQHFCDYKFYKRDPDIYFIGCPQTTLHSLQPSYAIIYKPGQTLYYGQFLKGLFNGQGTLKFNKGLMYTGDFKEGKPYGQGQVTDQADTFKFTGQWKESKRPIKGVLNLYLNKIISKIQFINFQNGDSQIYYCNGSKYTGFIDKITLLPHGSGKMEYSSGDIYQGEWLQGKFHGTGTYLWKTGQKYNGQYLEGLRDGQGTFHYSSKKYYTGTWKKGKRDGFGIILTQNGKLIKKGIYRNDIYNEQDTQNYLDNFMQKAPRQEVKSQLMQNSDKQQLSIEKNKISA